MSQKSHLNKLIDKNINPDESYPSQKPNQSNKQSPDPLYRSGRVKSRPNKLGINNGIPLQDKLISFARLMPKQHHQDKQLLYSENIKLKQKVRQLGQQNIRLKTRLNRSQKEKQQIFIEADKIANAADIRPYSKGGLRRASGSHHHSSKNGISLQSNYAAKKMFRDAKQEVEKLKVENQRIKKSIKYTQIAELQAENENLLQETSRLERYIQQIIKQDNYEQYEQAIDELKRKLHQQKEAMKNFPNQLRNKQEQIQQWKLKFKESQKNKGENEKRLNKEISYLKSEISNLRKGYNEMRVKQKDSKQQGGIIKGKPCQDCVKWGQEKKQLQKKINLVEKQLREEKQKQRSHYSNPKHPSNFRSNNSRDYSQNKSKQYSVQQSVKNSKSFAKEEVKLDQVATKKGSPTKKSVNKVQTPKSSIKNRSQLSNKSVQKKNEKRHSVPQVKVKIQNKAQKQIEQKVQTIQSDAQVQEYGNQQFQQQNKQKLQTANMINKQQQLKKEQKQVHAKEVKPIQKKIQSEQQQNFYQDYDQQFNQEIPQKKQTNTQQKIQKKPNDKSKVKQDVADVPSKNQIKDQPSKRQNIMAKQEVDDLGYEDDFNNIEEKKLQKQIQLDEDSEQEQVLFQKEPPKQQPKKHSSMSSRSKNKSTKSSDINKVLKQTITYKFMAQRYSYGDFESDLKNSGVATFTLQDIASMFSNEPFFLNEQQQQFMIIHCFGTTDIKETDVLPIKTFLKKMRGYIGEVQPIEQQEQQQLASQLSNAIRQNQKQIIKKLKKKEHQPGFISKKVFKKALTDLGLNTDKQIQYALSEISVCSPDVQNLNYIEFFTRFSKAE